MNTRPDLLYLGFTFPPGVAARHPAVNSFSHSHHARMVRELERTLCVHSINLLPFAAESPAGSDPSTGLNSELTLIEKKPELIHRLLACWKLQRFYQRTYSSIAEPKVIFVYNLSPIYNHFVRWMKRRPNPPKLILHLEDSAQLGHSLRGFKRFRYRLKPLHFPDDKMLSHFDGCIGLSQSAEEHFRKRGIPYLWLPGATDPTEIDPFHQDFGSHFPEKTIRFGYFGALSPYAGVMTLAESFLASKSTGVLEICGYGKLSASLAALAKSDNRLRFLGLMETPTDCLRFGTRCDVLVNPRPASHGNENNFPSKAFQYATCGRAMLTTRMGGIETVFGPDAYYISTDNLAENLRSELERLAEISRAEHRQRGTALRQRVMDHYTYKKWGEKARDFILGIAA